MTLRSKASYLLSLIIILVMGASGIYYLHFLQQSLKDSILAGVKGVSDTTSQGISNFLADSLKETQAVALALPVEALEKKDTPVIRARLKSLFEIFPKFENGMFILDKDGRLWVDYPQNPGPIGADFSYREYFQRTLKEGKGIIGVPYVSVRTGKPVLTFTALLRGSDKRVLGVLGCSVQMLSPDALGGIRKVKIGRSGYIFVFDTSRLMILHPENERVLKRDVPPGANKLLDAALEGFEGVGETVNSRGVPMLSAFKRIPGTDWIIGAQQLQDDAYFPIARARQGLILGIILMVVVAVLSVAVAIRRITEPLTKLRQAVMFLGKEESTESQKVAKELESIKGSDEFGELANAFLDMSKKLDETLISLKMANNDWERTFNAVPDLIAIIGKQRNIVRINQAMADRLGVKAQDAVGIKCHKLVHGTDEPLESCPHQRLLKDGQEHIEELMETWLGGTFLLTASPLRNQAGELIGSVHVARDITERKQAEEALRSTRDYLENIIANSADSIGIVDRRGRFTQWNKLAEELYGYTYEELKGRSAIDLYADPGEYYLMLKELHQHEFIKNYEINMKKKGGSVFPGSLSIRLLRNGDNEVIGSIAGCRDLSETKQMMAQLQDKIYQHEQARQALIESEKKLVSIIDFLPDATFVIDTKGKIIAWNKAIEDMTGVRAPDMVGKDNYEYALPFYEERRPILVDLVLEQEKRIERYDEVKREDRTLVAVAHFPNFRGKETYLSGKASALIDSHGNVIGSIETIRDITALRKAETDRLQFSKLESLSVLAGGIAHDFNNILTTIVGNIGLARLTGKLGEEEMGRLLQAEKACFRAKELSGQLLTFAKGGAPIKKVTSLVNLVNESAKLALAGSQSRCDFALPDNIWPVEIDEGQINQVISNLLINADQAMPKGGIIKIEARNIVVEEGSDLPLSGGNYVKLTITDQGIGIQSQYLDKIFDPYFTTKQKGSGLGLATVYSIIKKHYGHINVESQLGRGTAFEIYLPAKDGEPVKALDEPITPITGQGKVLVMDDDEKIREILGRMLGKLGYEVDAAGDGSQALEKFSKAKESGRIFDAVILDLTVPGGMGGKETIEKLLRIDPQVKAIVSSGYSDDPVMAEFQKYGFSAVIAKPYRIVELSKILQRIISKGGY